MIRKIQAAVMLSLLVSLVPTARGSWAVCLASGERHLADAGCCCQRERGGDEGPDCCGDEAPEPGDGCCVDAGRLLPDAVAPVQVPCPEPGFAVIADGSIRSVELLLPSPCGHPAVARGDRAPPGRRLRCLLCSWVL